MKTTIQQKRIKGVNRIKSATNESPAQAAAAGRKFPAKLEHILVPVDFSEHSLHALDVAEGLAKSAGGTITLLHVVEPMPATTEWSYLILAPQRVVKASQKKLENLANERGIDSRLIGRVLVKTGIPWNEIITTARELNRDLIVIATHGYTGWRHVLLGSTAERVIRHATCPVLVVR
jgi:nucleotide-binding universal stress UspA family protein